MVVSLNRDEFRRADKIRFEILKRFGVLIPLKKSRINFEKVVLLVLCGDGKKFYDKHGYFCQAHQTYHTHVISGAGHALFAAPPNKALSDFNAYKHYVVVKDILYGAEKFSTDTVGLIVHASCAVAEDIGLDLFEVLNRSVLGKGFLESMPLYNPQSEIECDFEYPVLTEEYLPFQKDIENLREIKLPKFDVYPYLHFAVDEKEGKFETHFVDSERWLNSQEEIKIAFLEANSVQKVAQCA